MKITTLRPRARTTTACIAAATALALLTACGSSSGGAATGSGPSEDYRITPAAVSADQTEAVLEKAFLTPDIKAADLDPIIVESLNDMSRDFSSDQISTALSCMDQPTCKIGEGNQTLAILDGAGGDLWRHITRAAITLHATAYPNIGTVMYLQADGNLQTMQAQLRTLVTRKVTGIVSYDDFGPAMTAAFQQATSAGIPVSVYGGTPGPDAVNAVLTQVQSDFCDDGYQMAEATQKIIGDKGNVAFFTGTPGNPQGAGWQKCAEEWFAKNTPEIKVVNKSDTSWTEGGATTATSALISTGQKVDAVLYDYAKQSVNIVQAYKQARVDVPAQITWTSDNSLLKMWEEDQKSDKPWGLAYSSSINYEGNIALTALMNHLAGEKVPAQLTFPMPFVSAKVGDYNPQEPPNGPGPTIMPAEMLSKVLAG